MIIADKAIGNVLLRRIYHVTGVLICIVCAGFIDGHLTCQR